MSELPNSIFLDDTREAHLFSSNISSSSEINLIITGGFIKSFLTEGMLPKKPFKIWTYCSAVQRTLIKVFGIPPDTIGRLPLQTQNEDISPPLSAEAIDDTLAWLGSRHEVPNDALPTIFGACHLSHTSPKQLSSVPLHARSIFATDWGINQDFSHPHKILFPPEWLPAKSDGALYPLKVSFLAAYLHQKLNTTGNLNGVANLTTTPNVTIRALTPSDLSISHEWTIKNYLDYSQRGESEKIHPYFNRDLGDRLYSACWSEFSGTPPTNSTVVFMDSNPTAKSIAHLSTKMKDLRLDNNPPVFLWLHNMGFNHAKKWLHFTRLVFVPDTFELDNSPLKPFCDEKTLIIERYSL